MILFRNSRILVIGAKQSLGILKFLSKIPYYVILGLDPMISFKIPSKIPKNKFKILRDCFGRFVRSQ